MKHEMKLNGTLETNAGSRRTVLWLVDDNAPLREILTENFCLEPNIECARQFDSAEAMLAALETNVPPDVILMDVNMRGMKGTHAIAPTKKLAPRTRVLMFTTFYDSRDALLAFRSGASGFLLKSYDFDRVARAVTDAKEVWPESWFKAKDRLLNQTTDAPMTDASMGDAQIRNHRTIPNELPGLGLKLARLVQTLRAYLRREPSTLATKLANWLF